MRPGPIPYRSASLHFFRAIEEHFVSRRGAPLILSPADWQVAAAWQERRIPLRVIHRAIDSVFETAAARGRGKTIRSLAYCHHAVEEEWARHLAAAVGETPASAGGEGPPRAPDRLRRAAARLEERAAGWAEPARLTASRAAAQLRDVASAADSGAPSPEALEEALIEIERALLSAVVAALPETARADLVAACDRRLAAYRSRMAPEVFERTRARALEAEIRRSLHLPPLSILDE